MWAARLFFTELFSSQCLQLQQEVTAFHLKMTVYFILTNNSVTELTGLSVNQPCTITPHINVTVLPLKLIIKVHNTTQSHLYLLDVR